MSLSDIRNGDPSRQMADEKMEQVRELLLGDYERQSEARVAILENRIRDLELSLHRRLDAMQARLDAISAELDVTHRHTLDEIGNGLQELAARIKSSPSDQ
ncbi:MAG: hypothetical protein AAGB04_24095 [Pseudomonadota bacterium]